jgi:hypothetical protein
VVLDLESAFIVILPGVRSAQVPVRSRRRPIKKDAKIKASQPANWFKAYREIALIVVSPVTTPTPRLYFVPEGRQGPGRAGAPGAIAFMSFIDPLFLFIFFPLLYAACLTENTRLGAKK